MIFQISHGTAEFADKAVFSDLNFEIRNKNDKIAVVGRNGCGKSSLLRLISGEISLSRHDGDEGSGIFMTGSPKIGYLKQISFENGSLTLDDEIRGVFKRILDMKERIEELVELMNDESYVNKTGHKALVSEYTRLRDEFQDIGGYYYEKEYEFIWPSLDNEKISDIGSCRGTRDHIGILVDGTVVPCCLDANGIINLGNIYKSNLDDIISSDLFLSMKQGFCNNKKVHELCQRCNFYDLRNKGDSNG